MMGPRRCLGLAVLAATVSVLLPAGSAPDKISDDAKAYQAQLEAMMGQETGKILDKLAAWKFEVVDAWMTDTAASKDFALRNKGKTKFSKKEIAEIFSPAGKYKVAVYGLHVASDSATMGTVDQFGMSYQKDATVDLRVFTIIRIVLRDEKLISVRNWPKMESSAVAGGTWRIR